MNDSNANEVMKALLQLWDWHIRFTTQGLSKEPDEYDYGYADAIGQCILDVGKVLGEETGKRPYKFEAYKRVMEYTTTAKYWKKYPTPLASYFPAEVIRANGGKL